MYDNLEGFVIMLRSMQSYRGLYSYVRGVFHDVKQNIDVKRGHLLQ